MRDNAKRTTPTQTGQNSRILLREQRELSAETDEQNRNRLASALFRKFELFKEVKGVVGQYLQRTSHAR